MQAHPQRKSSQLQPMMSLRSRPSPSKGESLGSSYLQLLRSRPSRAIFVALSQPPTHMLTFAHSSKLMLTNAHRLMALHAASRRFMNPEPKAQGSLENAASFAVRDSQGGDPQSRSPSQQHVAPSPSMNPRTIHGPGRASRVSRASYGQVQSSAESQQVSGLTEDASMHVESCDPPNSN